MLCEPVQAQSHGVIFFEPLSSNDGIIDAGRVSGHLAFFTTESIFNLNFLIFIDCAVEWHRHLLAVPVDCFRL